MTFSLPQTMRIFPALSPAWGIKRTMITATTVQRSVSQYRTTIQHMPFPRWRFSLSCPKLNSNNIARSPNAYDDLRSIMGFFAGISGQATPFLYSARDFHRAENQELELLQDDSGSWFSPLRASIGPFRDLVSDLDGPEQIFANGVIQTAGTRYTILMGKTSSMWSEPGLVVSWQSHPDPPITATFQYFYRCAFNKDELDLEWWTDNYWKCDIEFESEYPIMDLNADIYRRTAGSGFGLDFGNMFGSDGMVPIPRSHHGS